MRQIERKPLISTSNRSSNTQPLTVDLLKKSVFACFLYSEPVSDDMTKETYKREYEFLNNIRLLISCSIVLWRVGIPSHAR